MTRNGSGYVILDSTWGRRLGIRRSGGLYRISRRELGERLGWLPASVGEELSPPLGRGGSGLAAGVASAGCVTACGDQSHFVGFYETESFLVDSVRDFHAAGLVAGDAAVIVATEAHLRAFGYALGQAGVDLSEARRCGRFIALDASETLARFMVNGAPDAVRFRRVIGQLIARAAKNAHTVRVYGEMVAVLWAEGNVAAAIALEDLWNDLAAEHSFSLFCAYPKDAFRGEAGQERLQEVCERHSDVLHQGQTA